MTAPARPASSSNTALTRLASWTHWSSVMAVLAMLANCSGSGRAYRPSPGTISRTSSALSLVLPRVAMVPPVAMNLMRGRSSSAAQESMPAMAQNTTTVKKSAKADGVEILRSMRVTGAGA